MESVQCPMPHIAVKVNMLIDIDVDPVERDRITSRPLTGHCVYESFVLLPLKLCVKSEWSITKHCKKYLRKCEIINLVTRADHAHFVATPPFRKMFKVSCLDCPWKHARQT